MESKHQSKDWHHLLALGLIVIIVSTALVYFFLHTNLIPGSSSVESGDIDSFVKILFAIAAVFFTIVIAGLAYSLIFFRRRPGDTSDGVSIKGNLPLEWAWTIIPLIIVLILATYGSVVLGNMTAPGPPQTEMEIDVLAFRYGWQFTYPEYNITTYQLDVPVNQRLLIKLQSLDVVHSFWVPEWGPKQDAVPGITTEVRYTPDQTGKFTLYCSQLCGYGHSYMTAPVDVTSRADFQTWVQQQQQTTTTTPPTTSTSTSTAPPTTVPSTTFQTLAAGGQTVYASNCAVCHGAAGEGGAAPALWGSGTVLGEYSGVMLFTNAQDMLSFISAKMPLTAPGSLSAEQYTDLLAYILVQDNKVSASSVFVAGQLSNITLP